MTDYIGHSSSIDADSVLSILSGSLENYQKDEAVALGILAAMVAVLASGKQMHNFLVPAFQSISMRS